MYILFSMKYNTIHSIFLTVIKLICLPKDHVAFFIFGDSVVDDGNNNYIKTTTGFQSNFAPYGETFFRYLTGRSSNGRLITDFIGRIYTHTYIYIYMLISLGLEWLLN